MLVVAALGGNALLRRGEPMDAASMERNVKIAAQALAPIARMHRLVVTHGNGPQVALLASQAAAYPAVAPYPLDILGAETEGMIGYLLCRELRNCLPKKNVVTLLTQTVVSDRPRSVKHPDKFVGPIHDEATAKRIAGERGWLFRRQGDHYRRVVPSPPPCRIVEMPVIAQLADSDAIVVCAGGGGIPVAIDGNGLFHGVDAVVDKDLVSTWLAIELRADTLMFLTDVDAVYRDWGAPAQRPFGDVSVSELENCRFDPDSIGPKVEGACRFIRGEGRLATIGALDDALAMLEGSAGTKISS